MTSILAQNNQLEITFKKRSMRTYLTETRILDELEVDTLDSELEKVLALNFARFMANTESIRIVEGVEASQLSLDWMKFWRYSQTSQNYGHLFVAYTEQLPIEANNEWYNAFDKYENSDPTRNPIELSSPENVPDELLADPDVKKSESIDDTA